MKNPSAVLWTFAQAFSQLHGLWRQVLDLEGELPPDLEAQLDAAQSVCQETMREAVLCIKDLEGVVELHRKEERRLKERREKIEARLEQLKGWLSRTLPAGEKWTDGIHSLTWRRSVSVEADTSKLTYDYLRVEYSPDKAKIKRDLEAGIAVEGARLIEKNNIQIK